MQVFISYSRVNLLFVKPLYELLQRIRLLWHPQTPKIDKPRWKKAEFIIGAIIIPLIAALITLLPSLIRNDQPTPPPPATAIVAQRFTAAPTDQPTETATETPALTPTPTQALPIADVVATLDARATEAQATQAIMDATATLIAFRPQANDDWTPVEHDFDGVTMVLVPAGCFMMGNDDYYNDEYPLHEQCFDAPFWIDKYEVTQAQFARLGGTKANENHFSGDERPIDHIIWFEAHDFCKLRGSRLPTEAEWEYAARGPDTLIYPWGNTWNASNLIWDSQGTANVGSIPAGVSWVGALDMSGNVWEWTSSLHEGYGYPYDATDGREADTGSRTDVFRVVRGGAWSGSNTPSRWTTSFRYAANPGFMVTSFGFRCARDYE